MTWLLDIIIALIIGLSIFFGAKNGFIKTAIGAATFAVAIIVTAIFTDPLAGYLKTTAIAENIGNATEEYITDIMLDNAADVDELLNGESAEFNSFIAIAGLDAEELNQWYSENVVDSENANSLLAKKISEPIVGIIATVAAVIILYIGTQLILSIIGFIINKIFSLPVLKTCNTVLGVVLGAVLALVRISLFCFVVNILVENSDFLGIDMLSDINPDGTLLFKIFRNINIFSFFM